MGFELFLFLALGIVAIAAAALMIISKNAVHSAMFLILNFGCVALLFLMLDAPFISMVQIAVYAGAIMVLFLFVIMLLGAEHTTDTSRRFRWVTGVATILTASLLFALAVPIVLSGGISLPEAPGQEPMLRVVHAANLPGPVNVVVSGDAAEEDLVLEATTFGTISEYMALPAGDYNVSIVLAASGTPLFSQALTLAENAVVTAVAYGEFSTAAQTLTLGVVENSFATSGDDGARTIVFNAFSPDPLLLVDLGPDAVLDVSEGAIVDPVVTEAAFGAATAPAIVEKGGHTLAFYRQDGEEFVRLSTLEGWDVRANTEQTIMIVPDYDAPAGVDGYRPRVLDRNQEQLVVRTSESFGSPGDIGRSLFTDYLLPVNLVGFLLLVALIGVIVLTRPQGLTTARRSTINRRRKVSRPLVSVIAQQTGSDVTADTPKLDKPTSGD